MGWFNQGKKEVRDGKGPADMTGQSATAQKERDAGRAAELQRQAEQQRQQGKK